MRFVSTRAAVALALAFGAVSLSSYAARPEADAAVENAGVIKPVWTPPGISLKPATVIVQLAGDSVAERQGNAGRRLSRAEKDAIKGQLRSQQDAVRGAIQGLGGTVLATYQSAYNGIKVRISRNQVTSLA